MEFTLEDKRKEPNLKVSVVEKKSRTGKKMFEIAMKTDVGFESIEKKDLGCEGKISLLKRIKTFLVGVKLLIILRN